VTLEEMAQVVRDGSDVVVVDNTTKEDITYKTFIQLLHELERKSVGIGDVQLLNRVIRSSTGTFTGFINEIEGNVATFDAPTMEHVVTMPADVIISNNVEEMSAAAILH
jgi:polyhydroxyalkanoate synthesis regulator protein